MGRIGSQIQVGQPKDLWMDFSEMGKKHMRRSSKTGMKSFV